MCCACCRLSLLSQQHVKDFLKRLETVLSIARTTDAKAAEPVQTRTPMEGARVPGSCRGKYDHPWPHHRLRLRTISLMTLLTGMEWPAATGRELFHLAAEVKAAPDRYRAALQWTISGA